MNETWWIWYNDAYAFVRIKIWDVLQLIPMKNKCTHIKCSYETEHLLCNRQSGNSEILFLFETDVPDKLSWVGRTRQLLSVLPDTTFQRLTFVTDDEVYFDVCVLWRKRENTVSTKLF